MSESSRDQERWLPVLEYEGRYEVSDHGRVRSLDRTALKRSGVKQFHRGRIRKPNHHRAGHPFVSYAADAVIVATPTGSTAYSFSAGGPIVSPAVEALLVTPAAPHSAYNRGLVLSIQDSLALEILPASGRLAVEVDGQVAAHVEPGDRVELRPRPAAAHVVRLGRTTFYERARRKLRLTDSAEVPAGWAQHQD